MFSMDLTQVSGKPQARYDDLVIEEMADEVLVYDLASNKAHCLSHTAAAVWKRCDGQRGIDELACQTGTDLGVPVDADVVWFALEQLSHAHLLQQRVVRPPGGMQITRRALFARAGAVAAAAVVTSIVAPTAVQAASLRPSGATCSDSVQCQSQMCVSSVCM